MTRKAPGATVRVMACGAFVGAGTTSPAWDDDRRRRQATRRAAFRPFFPWIPRATGPFVTPVSFGVIRQAAEAASAANGPLHGYPPWVIVAGGAVLAAVLLWIFAKLVKWTVWLAIFVVLIGGFVMAARMFLGHEAPMLPTVAPSQPAPAKP